uniref:Fe2OG dioxygenase domain-containing protein n=1 Tax=Rhizochromulina marina TaxID=1034831 RepID=A0A7S2WFP1_9STRA
MVANFQNTLNKDIDVWWHGNGDLTFVGTIGAGDSERMNTFDGHMFYWGDRGKGPRAVTGQLTMQAGVDAYDISEGSRTITRVSAGAAESSPACQDRKDMCGAAAIRGECSKNPGWMIVNCPFSCNACDLLDPKVRCDRSRLNITNTPFFAAGGLSSMFQRIFEDFGSLEPALVHEDPWIVTFDNFLNASEADALYHSVDNFVRSTDTGSYNKFGEAEKLVSRSRTSENAWCREGCDNNPLVQSIIQRIEAVTTVPYENFEQFQVLRYREGQYYKVHHDFGPHQVNLACGPRILTFFLYLSDVEEGGETHFPKLGIKVKPKLGRALLWPSVKDSDVNKQESLTFHEALPVIKGEKLAANAWIHLYNFHVPNLWGCTGAFD